MFIFAVFYKISNNVIFINGNKRYVDGHFINR